LQAFFTLDPQPWLWFFMRMLFEPGRIGLWMVLIFASHKEQSHGKSSLCEQTTFCGIETYQNISQGHWIRKV
jgi:hypothetical protein